MNTTQDFNIVQTVFNRLAHPYILVVFHVLCQFWKSGGWMVEACVCANPLNFKVWMMDSIVGYIKIV